MNKPNSGEAAFMGRMTAGVTHEMKNVLAIIKESAGLMEDILSLTKDQPMPHREKIAKVLSNIAQQVERGVDLATRLNALAHCPDTGLAEVDLNIAVDQVAHLAQRIARLKKVTLGTTPQPEPVTLARDPLRLHMLFVDCIDRLLTIVPSGSAIRMEPMKRPSGQVGVQFSSEGNQQSPSEATDSNALEGLLGSAEAVNGAIELGAFPVWFTVIFD